MREDQILHNSPRNGTIIKSLLPKHIKCHRRVKQPANDLETELNQASSLHISKTAKKQFIFESETNKKNLTRDSFVNYDKLKRNYNDNALTYNQENNKPNGGNNRRIISRLSRANRPTELSLESKELSKLLINNRNGDVKINDYPNLVYIVMKDNKYADDHRQPNIVLDSDLPPKQSLIGSIDKYSDENQRFHMKPKKLSKRAKSEPVNFRTTINYHHRLVVQKNTKFSLKKDFIYENDLLEDPEPAQHKCKEILILEPTHSDKDTKSYDIDEILMDNMAYDNRMSKCGLAFSEQSDSMFEAEVANSRETSLNKRKLKYILKNNKVEQKNEYYEIEFNRDQSKTLHSLSYVLAVGMTVGAVGFYMASQTVQKSLRLLNYLK